MSAKIILTVISGSLQGQKFEFSDRTTCIIGRAKDCSLKLPNDESHKTISRYHCLLDINPPDIRVRDFGSLHGTYINGKIIGKRRSDQTPEEAAKIKFPEYDLKEGDKIKLGSTTFQVTVEETTVESENQPASETIPLSKLDLLADNKELISNAVTSESNFPTFPGYTIIKLLGKGGFGEVYLARQDRNDKLVALKVMRPQMAANQRAKEMFLREVENTKALQHTNVVQLEESGYYDDIFFFTLEYCDGGSVSDLIKQRGGRLSINQAVSIILQILDGLEYAHNAEISFVKLADGSIGKGHGLVHRDLKPANILLTNNGANSIAKIADYGLAKAFDLAGLSGLSMSGNTAGTPAFMPRQQVINFKYAKPEVDIWASAACLYYMLTGTFPRDSVGQDPWLVVLQSKAVPIRQRDGLIPNKLAELIDLALVDNPTIHFKSAIAFKLELESVL